MANREILHSLFASFCGGFDIFEQNLFINATHLYLFIILLSLPFIIFMVSFPSLDFLSHFSSKSPSVVCEVELLITISTIASARVTSQASAAALSLSSLSGIAFHLVQLHRFPSQQSMLTCGAF